MLKVIRADRDGAPVFELIGRLDGTGAVVFDQELAPQLTGYVLLDFAQVGFLSSAGIRSLLMAEKRLRAAGGGLVLANLDDNLREVLDLTGLLGQFAVTDSMEAPAGLLTRRMAGADELACGARCYKLQALTDDPSAVDDWGPVTGNEPCEATLAEVGYAFGVGGLGATLEQARLGQGICLAAGGFFGVVPAAGPFDYALTRHPERTDVWMGGGIGFSGPAALHVTHRPPWAGTLGELAEDLLRLVNNTPALGFAGLLNLAGERPDGAKAVFVVGLALDAERGMQSLRRELAPLGGNTFLRAHGVLLATAPQAQAAALDDCAQQAMTMENVLGVEALSAGLRLNGCCLWLWTPAEVRSAEEKRMRIECADIELEDEWLRIVRRIYDDASRVELNLLPGGFTSRTFRVTSYDRAGRRQLPTVLKIGGIELTRAEEEAYHAWVKKFILNNSTTILGTHYAEHWAGLRYNFLGIGGAESKLTMLRDLYLQLPVDELLPLFDRIFTDILKPWYGQPRWEQIDLCAEHDPKRLFPGLIAIAEQVHGLSADDPTLHCPQLGRSLPNPYWFYKHRYPQGLRRMAYRCICHGDLNPQNIMLDERQNIYIIDFSETRPRNCMSDFARLEVISKMEFTRMATDDDVAALLRWDEGLQAMERIDEQPLFAYEGADPAVRRAWEVIRRVRHYADQVTIFETDPLPWFMAALEWTLPVAAYRSAGPLQKRFALYSAGLLCERILALTEKNR